MPLPAAVLEPESRIRVFGSSTRCGVGLVSFVPPRKSTCSASVLRWGKQVSFTGINFLFSETKYVSACRGDLGAT